MNLHSNICILILFNKISRSWTGPARASEWTNLPTCIKFISDHGCIQDLSLNWVRLTLDRLSCSATTEQLIHIFNGYADLYKLILYVIQINDNILVDAKDIHTYGGTSSKTEQEKRNRNIVFIMFNSDNFLFAPLYVTRSDSHPQTCFATDDERIVDHIKELLDTLNHESKILSGELINVFSIFIKYPNV